MNAHTPVRNRLAPLGGRLAPLLGKLDSHHDPEVLASVRAIRRLLERHRLTMTDLGRALEAGTAGHRPTHPEQVHLREMAEHCAARTELLTEKEADFVANMLRLLRRPDAMPSAKQVKWLFDIHDRLCEGVS